MADEYDIEERLAIRMFDGGMTEKEAVRAEQVECEAVRRAKLLRDRMRADKLGKRVVCFKDRAAGN